MEAIHSIILGLVQGFTEFLPISSSAHLVLIPKLFGWQYNGLSFDIALHFGTVVAIVAFFWRDWKSLILSAIDQTDANDKGDYPKNLLWQILLATIPAGIVGYLIADIVETKLHSPYLLAINLIVFGLVLYLVDKFAKKNLDISKINYGKSLIVGLAQCFALIPGVSRSGVTILASRAIGLTREKAARFSFLLGTPAMIGAFVFDLKGDTSINLDGVFVFGFIASLISGWIAIKLLLYILKKTDFAIFMYYRLFLGLLVLALAIFGFIS